MFQGSAALNLDAKGRMAIPARHRDALAGPGNGVVVVTAHLHPCLLVYPLPAWEPIRNRILEASSFEDRPAGIKRRLVGYAVEETMDAAGRLLIPPELRKLAGLEKEVYLVGLGSHFELWSAEGWQRQNEILDSLSGQALPPSLADLAL